MKRRNLVTEYYTEYVLFGGEMMPRRQVIRELEAVAPNKGCVDMYLFGLDRQMANMIGTYCDLATGEEKR